MQQYPFHNLGLDLARATEAAALASGRWMGRADAEGADKVATAAMRAAFNSINIRGRVVLSEKDKLSPDVPLHPGEAVGTGYGPEMDIVLDPIEGRDLLSLGHPDAISVAVAAPRDSFWAVPPATYMEKIIVDNTVAPVLVPECMDAPIAWTLALVARAKGKHVSDLVVFVLQRPRHASLIQEIRQAGARVSLRSAGDVVGALKTITLDTGIDVLLGIGNFPEGLVAACAVKSAQGAMLGRLAPQSEAEKDALIAAGYDLNRIYTTNELVRSDQVFFAATGITDGSFLPGVQFHGDRATSSTLIMRGETHTRRLIQAEHLLVSDKEYVS